MENTRKVKQFEITRTTVRKAISTLVNEGLPELVQGKGTFVRLKELQYSVWNFGGFTDYVKNRGEVPISNLIEKDIMKVDGKPYLKLKRAHGVKKGEESVILTINTSMISLDKFPNIDMYDFEKESIYDVMRTNYHIYPKYYETVIKPVECDDEVKGFFSIDSQTYLLKANVKVTDEGGGILSRRYKSYSDHEQNLR